MVNHNEILESVLDKKFTVVYNGKTFTNNFIEGDIFQVWEVLNKKQTKYPLIWLQSGYRVRESILPGNKTKEMLNCSFYLITKGDAHDFNSKRYSDTYKFILYPLLEKFKKGISETKGISLSNEYDYITFPFNDISELSAKESNSKRLPQKTTISDIWDAVYLNIGITINGGCFPEFTVK
ncbi:hypothetical protein ATE47_04170 [Chryseobacterium sp. IHB B 17019]|uniref:hypothetical protein n=1 Tax=Chryseobacterium sp. IHB B 17019 TaxID=1721091 RepID=UPI000722AE46|nr:hypothetical protein [Chryseobacterium sp. IHB B 17019]ALR29765.1 hypothetical protein ATE47_04170 [Chryseobacterium sp. IHB B 17019]